MRVLMPVAALALLTACVPPPHLQNQGGVGFGDTPVYQPPVFQPQVAPAPSAVPGASGISSAEINSALYGTAAPAAPQATAPVLPAAPAAAVVVAGTDPAAEVAPNNLGISDEQDFSAVASRETIETDKQRIEANKAHYQQIAPTALPERTGSAGVSDLVNYALSAPNRLGEAVYKRRTVTPEAHQRACLRYPTDEAAQEAFLKAGGPERDGKKLDPDGDGFACDWDPTPFQKARGG